MTTTSSTTSKTITAATAHPPTLRPIKGSTAKPYLALNDAVGTPLQIHEGGKMITDPDDGSPTGVATLRTSEVPMAPPIITRADLDAAGQTPEEVPNVHVV